jgi:prostaglandin-endoperoxide synthase 2
MLPPDNYCRLDPMFPAGTTFDIDALHKIPELKEFAEGVCLDPCVEWIRTHWLSEPAAAAQLPQKTPRRTAFPQPAAIAEANRRPLPGGRDTSKDGFRNKLTFWFLTHLRGLWAFAQRVPPLERFVNAWLINKAINYAPTRPNPLSTRDSHSSWASMADRTYFSRHLPPTGPSEAPDADRVKELFRRPADAPRLSSKSTALFACFAQWFTDGFLRTDFSDYPKNRLKNTSNHDIDLCNLYGLREEHTHILREHERGRLKSQWIRNEEFPPFYFDREGKVNPEFAGLPEPLLPAKRQFPLEKKQYLFAMGGERANVFTGYAMMNVLFLREHNRIAGVLENVYPDWDDDRIFQTTRNILTVVLLRIVVEDYINHITPYHFQFRLHPGRRIRQEWHRPNWVAIEFDLLYRWHTLMPDEVRIGEDLRPLEDCVLNSGLLTQYGLRAAFDGANRQQACEISLFNTSASLLDRAEKPTIALGRLAELQGYNAYREWCSFPQATHVRQISSVPVVREALMDTYHHVDAIELYAGLFAEDVRRNSVLPPLMGRMVGIDALSQALTNPLVSRQIHKRETFSVAGLQIIDDTGTLNDVVARNIKDAPIVSFTHAGFRRV